MKKINALLMGGIMIALVACGPGAEDIEAQRQDSIHRADSIAAAEMEAAAAEQAYQDSIAAAAADTTMIDTTVVAK